MKSTLRETEINLISEGSRLEGRIQLDSVTRVHGTLIGEVRAPEGSTLVLAETGVIEGTIQGDTVLVDGFVRGDIAASRKIRISGSGRVIGNLRAPSVEIEFGAHFEGKALSGKLTPEPA